MRDCHDREEEALQVVSGAGVSIPEIADYEFLETLGKGGSSAVFKARQRTMDRIVAVKVLHSVHDPAALRRFESEVKLTFAIDHPNIVKILSYGVSADERAYLVLEYLEGESLAQKLTRGPLTLSEFRAVFVSLLGALTALHRANIVHRDVKPGNIFLCANSETEMMVKLLDMGIAQTTSGDVTMDGTLVGSPAYMSPEQCAGAEVDGRSDLYSLGLVMYESITGKPLFHGESALDTMLKQAKTSAPTTLSLCKRAGIPADLARCLLKCLAKRPQERYPDADALLGDLEQYLLNAAEFSSVKYVNRKNTRWMKIVAIALFVGVFSALTIAVANRVRPEEPLFSMQRDPDVLLAKSSEFATAGDTDRAIELVEQAMKQCHGDSCKRTELLCNLSIQFAKGAMKASAGGDRTLVQRYVERCEAAANECLGLCKKAKAMDVGIVAASSEALLQATVLLGGKSAFVARLTKLEQVPQFQSGRGLEGVLTGAARIASKSFPLEPLAMELSRRVLDLHQAGYGEESVQVMEDRILINRIYCRRGNRKEADKVTAQLMEELNSDKFDIPLSTRRDNVVVLVGDLVASGDFDKAEEVVTEHLRWYEIEYRNEPLILLDFYEVRGSIAAGKRDWTKAIFYYEKAVNCVADQASSLRLLKVRQLENIRKVARQENGAGAPNHN